jgi:hypothetical protein
MGHYYVEIPRNTVPSIRGTYNIVKKVKSAGSLLDKKPAKKAPRAY